MENRAWPQEMPELPEVVSLPGRWVDAASLRTGDLLYLVNGNQVSVDSVTSIPCPEKVFNLEVAEIHTYAVGRIGVLVHNNNGVCPGSGGATPNTLRGAPTNLGPVSSKAPKQVNPGVRELEGHYIDDLGRLQPWRAHYDEHGRMIGRTDYNAGNRAAGIPNIHHERWEYNALFPKGRKVENHIPGEFPQ